MAGDTSYQFDLDLLTSFDVRSKSGSVLTPEDGLRRFRQMVEDQTLGEIVRVRLRVEPTTIVITDNATNADMEHIPLNLISQIVHVMDRSFAPYDNILVFTVLEDSFQMAPPEMYFFQCLSAPAQRIVDTLTAAASGKLRFSRKSTPAGGGHVRRPSNELSKIREYEQQAQRSAKATSTYLPGPAPGEMFRQSINKEDPANEKTTQNIRILDHCLDDIEKFVARLQQAADAFKKLEQRRTDRQASGNAVGPGDGMLIMRARPPPAIDFISIFQKFKLAFNLLASLKGYIHNPNAPEMIHFLFTPLGLVVDASKEPVSGLPALADKVVSPLLSIEAVQLLSDCLTSRENQLWMSLGDAWTQDRDHWKGQVPPPYVPIFSDGWSPPPYWMEDTVQLPPGPVGSDHMQPVVLRTNTTEDSIYRRENRISEPERPKRTSAIYPISEITGVVDEKQQKFVWELLARGAKIFMLVEPYTAANQKELTARKGDIVEVLDDSRNWWQSRNASGATGYLPRTLLKQYVPNDPKPFSPVPTTPSPKQNRASYNGDRTSVAIPPPISGRVYQEPVPVPRSSSTSQLQQQSVDLRSSAPYVDPPIASPRASVHSEGGRSSFPDDRHLVAAAAAASNIYQDPPLAQRLSASGIDPSETYGLEDSWDGVPRMGYQYQRTAVDDLNDEFRKKMSVPGVLTRPETKPRQTVYLHQDSTGDEILYWLQVKGFSLGVQEVLCQYDGKQLFGASKATLERIFGADEGGRLYSQLLVQRNRSGFKTARSSELQAILKQRKRISDVAGDNKQSAVVTADQGDGERF